MGQALCWVAGIQWGKRQIQSLPSWSSGGELFESAFKILCKSLALLYKAGR